MLRYRLHPTGRTPLCSVLSLTQQNTLTVKIKLSKKKKKTKTIKEHFFEKSVFSQLGEKHKA